MSASTKLAESIKELRRNLDEVSGSDEELPDFIVSMLEEMRDTITVIECKRARTATTRTLLTTLPRTNEKVGTPQKREILIESLKVLGRPAPPAIVARVAQYMFDETIPSSQFASLRKGDERAYFRGRRNRTFLVPALSVTGFTSRPGTIALSDWSSEARLIGLYTERVNTLHIIARCIQLEKEQNKPQLRAIYQPLASSFNLTIGSRHTVEQALAFIYQELGRIELKDKEERRIAAVQLAKYHEAFQLFGVPVQIHGGATLF